MNLSGGGSVDVGIPRSSDASPRDVDGNFVESETATSVEIGVSQPKCSDVASALVEALRATLGGNMGDAERWILTAMGLARTERDGGAR